MLLTLHSGQQVEFADVELGQILVRLQAQNQSYCLGEHDTAQIRVGGGLLIVDTAWTIGRRLVEGYQIGSDSTFPYGIKFTLGRRCTPCTRPWPAPATSGSNNLRWRRCTWAFSP